MTVPDAVPLDPPAHAIPYSCAMSGATAVFADLIRQARENKGWSQTDLEIASGVSRSTISRWERGITVGRPPEAEHVRAVCLALDIDPRLAAVALGFLSADEISDRPHTQPPLDPMVKEALDVLADMTVPADVKREWIAYLKYLQQRHSENPGQQKAV